MNTLQDNETYQKIIKIFQNISEERIYSTEKKILDILSLVPNAKSIDGEKIFIKNKKKHGGTLNIEKFLQK